jgi:predicted nuclease of predicted toxin-antitoxin system
MSDPITITLLTDEDVDGPAITIAREQFGLQVIRVVDAGFAHTDDLEVFRYAEQNGYVVVTGNFKDFPTILAEWVAAGNQHSGVIIIGSKHHKNSLHIARKLAEITTQDMRNRVEWI